MAWPKLGRRDGTIIWVFSKIWPRSRKTSSSRKQWKTCRRAKWLSSRPSELWTTFSIQLDFQALPLIWVRITHYPVSIYCQILFPGYNNREQRWLIGREAFLNLLGLRRFQWISLVCHSWWMSCSSQSRQRSIDFHSLDQEVVDGVLLMRMPTTRLALKR